SGFDRSAGLLPGAKAARDVAYRFETHPLQLLRGESRAESARAEEHELLAGVEDLAMVRSCGIDPELEHAARRMQGARYPSVAIQFPDIANINKNHVRIGFKLDSFRRADRFDFRVRFRDQFSNRLLQFERHVAFLLILESARGFTRPVRFDMRLV